MNLHKFSFIKIPIRRIKLSINVAFIYWNPEGTLFIQNNSLIDLEIEATRFFIRNSEGPTSKSFLILIKLGHVFSFKRSLFSFFIFLGAVLNRAISHYGQQWATMSHYDPPWATLIHYDPLWVSMIHYRLLWSTLTQPKANPTTPTYATFK